MAVGIAGGGGRSTFPKVHGIVPNKFSIDWFCTKYRHAAATTGKLPVQISGTAAYASFNQKFTAVRLAAASGRAVLFSHTEFVAVHLRSDIARRTGN